MQFGFAGLAVASAGCDPSGSESSGLDVSGNPTSGGDVLTPEDHDADDSPSGADQDPSGPPPNGGDTGIPCDVQSALAASCWQCHAASPSFGAPMALAHRDDFLVPAPTDPTTSVSSQVIARLYSEDAPMPPTGDIAEADKQAIVDWLDAGAPAAADACDVEAPKTPTTGPEALACDVSATMVAFGEDGSDSAFEIPAQGADNLYRCFAFRSPFREGEQATAWAPIIDDARVVHHWILYRTDEPQVEGKPYKCDVGLQLSTEFVAGWAPGGTNAVMPENVGLELGADDTWYILQVHYNNTANHENVRDKSGVAFCTTPTPREHTASTLTVGSVTLAIPPGAEDYEEVGTCTSRSWLGYPDELTILGSSPHMHAFGRAFRTEILRDGGETEMLVDVPVFDYESQAIYLNEPAVTIRPGDRLRTTCVYDNPTDSFVFFGEDSEDEMCFNFILAYPVDKLLNRNCGFL